MKSIIMYHYIRETGMGLTPEAFDKQLTLLSSMYRVLPLSELLRDTGSDPVCAITFDDGLKDAVISALPILLDHGFSAAFFVPGAIFHQKTCLDVQRRHLLMMKLEVASIIEELNESLPEHLAIKPTPAMQADYLDDLTTASMKWSLDHFPPEIVSPILRRLVAKYLGDESQLFENLYLSRDDIQKLLNAGMEIGGHGFTHRPLGKLYYYDQLNELSHCATTIRDLIGRRPLMLSYPSGDYTPITMRIAEHLGFSNAFTIQKYTAESSPGPLEIGRFDCISIPSPAELQ